MNVLFVASTGLQLINAMTIIRDHSSFDHCDLLYGERLEAMTKSIGLKKYFHDSFVIPSIQDCTFPYLSKVLSGIRKGLAYKGLLDKIPTNVKKYDRIFVPGLALYYYLVYYAVHACSSKVQLSIYEEGICEYYTLAKVNRIRMFYSKLFFGCYHYEECDSLYVHRPEYVSCCWRNMELKKISSPLAYPDLVRDLKNTFGYDEKAILLDGIRFIFVDQCYDGFDRQEEREEQQKAALSILVQEMKKNQLNEKTIAVKLHPKSKPDKYGGGFRYIQSGMPFELIAINMNLEKAIFISVFSSVLINFKLILNQEPPVLVLQNIYADFTNDVDKNIAALFEKVRRDYTNKKFYIPKSEEEYKNILSQIVKQQESSDNFS